MLMLQVRAVCKARSLRERNERCLCKDNQMFDAIYSRFVAAKGPLLLFAELDLNFVGTRVLLFARS
jgi:hypothetical protein